jgi:hypothetical protein
MNDIYIRITDALSNQYSQGECGLSPLQFAERHIELLTGSADTPICFRVIAPDGRARNINGTLAERWAELEQLNRSGWQLYLVVNEGGHSADEITRVRSLFIDMDGKPDPEQWHVDPDFLVHRDATHWHAYWRVDDMPVAEFTRAQKRLIAYYGSDREYTTCRASCASPAACM